MRLAGVTRDLLAYLFFFAGQQTRRERLVDLFWLDSDPGRARAALNTALWRIKSFVGTLQGVALRSNAELVGLDVNAEVAIDARRLESAVRRAADIQDSTPALPAELRAELAADIDAYAGPFLEGSTLDWVLVERERLFNIYVRGLAILMQHSGHVCHYEDALEYGRRIIAADPFREQVQCEVMWLYVLNGQRAQALMQYRRYEAQLANELGIKPMAETRALAEYIQSDREEHRLTPAPSPAHPLGPVGAFRAAVERSRRDTYRALHASQP